MTAVPPDRPSVTLLVVDDELENAGLVERALHDIGGLEILSAPSGEIALSIIRARHVDILLVDQAMPGMTGIELVEQARKLVPRLIFVMVTAYPELEQVLHAQQIGLIHHLVAKPWRSGDIQGAVRRALIIRDLQSTVERLRSADSGGEGDRNQ